ncbi:MAG: hypothetical protein R3C56_26500 [Pirellulaceae bacterium]
MNEQLKGDVSSNPAVLKWHRSETPDVSIPLIVDDLVYLLHKDGKLQCVELATGKELYQLRTHTVAPFESGLCRWSHILLWQRWRVYRCQSWPQFRDSCRK